MTNSDLVDLVLCFPPSTLVSLDFKEALSTQLYDKFDGKIGAAGQYLTYQYMQ